MTNGDLINMLIKRAEQYTQGAIESVKRNKHMNSISEEAEIPQDIVDAIVVDFVNFIGGRCGRDVGFYTRDLKTKGEGK